MFLNYLALALILIVLVILFYTFIYIHELPYEVAKHRHHPHKDAIYVACWLSLFTLHAIWPLVYLWAMTAKRPSDEELAQASAEGGAERTAAPATNGAPSAPSDDWRLQLAQLETRLKRLEENKLEPAKGSKGAKAT